MKKITVILTGVLLTIGVVFAATGSFTDESNFAGWYKDAVLMLKNIGVISGYPDGSFRPQNNVNRAELAVMLKRYDEYRVNHFDDLLAAKLLSFMAAQEKFANIDVDVPSYYKNLIILAETGLRRIEGTPSDLNQYSLDTDIGNLPTGYSIYSSPGIIISYYVRYKGPRVFGDIEQEVDEWYGRF